MRKRRSHKYSNLGRAGIELGTLWSEGRDLTNCANHASLQIQYNCCRFKDSYWFELLSFHTRYSYFWFSLLTKKNNRKIPTNLPLSRMVKNDPNLFHLFDVRDVVRNGFLVYPGFLRAYNLICNLPFSLVGTVS